MYLRPLRAVEKLRVPCASPRPAILSLFFPLEPKPIFFFLEPTISILDPLLFIQLIRSCVLTPNHLDAIKNYVGTREQTLTSFSNWIALFISVIESQKDLTVKQPGEKYLRIYCLFMEFKIISTKKKFIFRYYESSEVSKFFSIIVAHSRSR